MLELLPLNLESTRATILPIFQSIRDAYMVIINWINNVLTAIFVTTGSLYSIRNIIFIGIGISIVFFAIKFIRHVVWGD